MAISWLCSQNPIPQSILSPISCVSQVVMTYFQLRDGHQNNIDPPKESRKRSETKISADQRGLLDQVPPRTCWLVTRTSSSHLLLKQLGVGLSITCKVRHFSDHKGTQLRQSCHNLYQQNKIHY